MGLQCCLRGRSSVFWKHMVRQGYPSFLGIIVSRVPSSVCQPFSARGCMYGEVCLASRDGSRVESNNQSRAEGSLEASHIRTVERSEELDQNQATALSSVIYVRCTQPYKALNRHPAPLTTNRSEERHVYLGFRAA